MEDKTWGDFGYFSDCLMCSRPTDGMCSKCEACCCMDCLHEHECGKEYTEEEQNKALEKVRNPYHDEFND